jgi:tetratricopeptide (TPR) repeat protein
MDGAKMAEGMEALATATNLGMEKAVDATAAAYRALHCFEATPTRRGRAAAHLLIGKLAAFTDDLGEAREHLRAAQELFAEVGMGTGGLEARLELGRLYTRLGDLPAAGVEFAAAVRLSDQAGDQSVQAITYRELGSWARRSGDIKAAVTHYGKAAALFEEARDRAGLASLRLSVGNLCLMLGEFADAMANYADAVTGFQRVGDVLGEANSERFFAQAARLEGYLDEAAEHYRRALDLYVAIGDHLGQSYTRQALGELAASDGEAGIAREHLGAAVELFARAGDPIRLIDALDSLIETYTNQDDRSGALRVMAWGVAQVREAGRWAVGERMRSIHAMRISDLEARALALAAELAEPAMAGQVIEGGVAGLVGVLPVLLAGPSSSDPKTESLRRRLQHLARQLDGSAGGGTGAAVGSARAADPTTAQTASPNASDRAGIIAQLEKLMGPRAKEVVSPRAVNYPAAIEAARSQGAVIQYSCPKGIVAGKPLYVVWATHAQAPRLSRVILSNTAADRLNLLSGASLTAGDLAADGTVAGSGPDPEAFQARGLGLDLGAGDPAAIAQARQLARRTLELWSALDRDPQVDPVAAETASALFPPGLAECLEAALDPATGLPSRLLVVPGRELWNLPWPGLVATADGRRLIDLARVSLAPSLSCLKMPAGDGRRTDRVNQVAAWIPATGPGTVEGTGSERAMVAALFGRDSLAPTPERFLTELGQADAAITSVHGNQAIGLSHGVHLTASMCLSAADLIALDLPPLWVIGACWSARVEANGEPFALPLIAHARGAEDLIGGVYPLPDAPPFPTARLLTQVYPALLGTDPASALWLAQHEAYSAGAAPRTWAGVTHTTTRLG